MPRRSDTLETVLLVLELLKRIPRGRKISASELHAQLSGSGEARDLRTIQRQLEMLARHFDIERDERSKPFGYRWKDRSPGLSLPSLSPRESLVLLLAEKQLTNLLPASVMRSMDGFFRQARMNLGQQPNARREREWADKVRVVPTSQPLLPPKLATGVLESVSEALFGNFWLEVEYRRRGREEGGNYTVMPLGLAQQDTRLYLVVRFKGHVDDRILALHRIAKARVQTLTFEPPKEFDLARFDAEGRFGFGEGQRVRLRFRIRKDEGFHLLESPLSLDQKVVELDDAYEITATVNDTAQLSWWLRGFGDAVTVVSRRVVKSRS